MFATSHLWCSLPWWIHCPLACSVAKESQRTFHLCGERFSFVDWTTESSLIRRSANFGNVSPFSSTGRGNKHLFRAYPSTLKIPELCFETTAAHSIISWSAQLGFLPLREAGTGFVGVLPLSSTHAWSSRKHRSLYAETTHKIAFAIPSRNQAPDVSNYKEDGVVNRFLTARRHFWTPWSERTHYMEKGQSVFFISPHLPYVFGHVRLTRLLLRCSYATLNQFWEKKPTVLQSKIRATFAITELYATNEIMIKKHVLFLTWLVTDDNYLSW